MLQGDSVCAGCVDGIKKSVCISQPYEPKVAPSKPSETLLHTLPIELPCVATKQGPKFRELAEAKCHPGRGGHTKTQEGPRLPA